MLPTVYFYSFRFPLFSCNFLSRYIEWRQTKRMRKLSVCYDISPNLDNIFRQNMYLFVGRLRSFDAWAVSINLSRKINDFDGSSVHMLIAWSKCSTWICSSNYRTKAHLMPLTQCPSVHAHVNDYKPHKLLNHSIKMSHGSCTINRLPIENRCNNFLSHSINVYAWMDRFKLLLITFQNCIDMKQQQQRINHSCRTYNDQHLILMIFLFVYSFFIPRFATSRFVFFILWLFCCSFCTQQIQCEQCALFIGCYVFGLMLLISLNSS